MVLDVIPPWGGEPAFTLLASPDHTHGAKQTKQSLAPATSPLARVRASLAGSHGSLPYVQISGGPASSRFVRVILAHGPCLRTCGQGRGDLGA